MADIEWIKVDRGSFGESFLHPTEPVWIVHYPRIADRLEFWQAYRAVARVPRGRMPWTVDNRRMGPEKVGFRTRDEAAAAVQRFLSAD